VNDLTAPKADEANYKGLERALRDQLRDQPDLAIARAMLLELYFKTGQRAAFSAEARKLLRTIDNPATSLEWQRCASMGRLLDPTTDLYRNASPELFEAAQAATAAQKMRRFGERKEYAGLFHQLAASYAEIQKDRRFLQTLDMELVHSANRPSSMLHLRHLSEHLGGAQIYLKREDLAPRDTHMTMMVAGQVLLARELGRKMVVTSTINGARGLVTASIAARHGLKCVVYMDVQDSQRHRRNVFRMSLMEVDLETVDVTTVCNHDVREVALEHWAAHPSQCFMVAGLDAVPPPYPMMHREFTSAIGRECRRQALAIAKRAPDVIVARGRTAADALGLFPPFLAETGTRLVCVEPAKAPKAAFRHEDDEAALQLPPLTEAERHAAPDIVEGTEYPNVEREHDWLKGTGRVDYVEMSESKVTDAILQLAKFEGLVPSFGMARPLAWACEEARRMDRDKTIVVMFAENDEKDLDSISRRFGMTNETEPATPISAANG
jgi:tryptophan synthase beta chain